jgi:hypothetical protein
LRTAGNNLDQLAMKYEKCGDQHSLPETLHELRTEFKGELAKYSPYCFSLLSLLFLYVLSPQFSSSFILFLVLYSFFFFFPYYFPLFIPLLSLFISASPPSIPCLNFLPVHNFALHFFHAEIQSSPFITTQVYTTPRL